MTKARVLTVLFAVLVAATTLPLWAAKPTFVHTKVYVAPQQSDPVTGLTAFQADLTKALGDSRVKVVSLANNLAAVQSGDVVVAIFIDDLGPDPLDSNSGLPWNTKALTANSKDEHKSPRLP